MKRTIKGIWIPKEIWEDPKLSIMEKVLLMEIDSLDGEDGCFASNKYLSAFLGVDKSSLIKYLRRLKEKGFIREEQFDGRKRILKSNIKTIVDTGSSSATSAGVEPATADLSTLLPLSIDKKNEIKDIDIAKAIFLYYQEKIFPTSRLTPNVIKKIRARLKTYSVDELKEAINKFGSSAWFMKHNSRRSPVWFFGSDERIEKDLYIVPDQKKKVIHLV